MHPDDWARLAKLVAGEGSPVEREEIARWAAADPDRSRTLAAMRSAWDLGVDSTAPFDKSKAWESILRRKAARTRGLEVSPFDVDAFHGDEHPGFQRTGTNSRGPSRVRRIIPFVAAACLLPLAILAGLRLTHRNDREVVQRAAPTRDFTTSRGQRAELRLTDGTNVILAAQSRLSIPSDYDSVSRHVTLVGEAYFDVAHSARPFIVRAGEGEVRDIGTRFDVRSYPDSAGLRVLVTAGKVELKSRSEALPVVHPLVRGQLAHLGRNGMVRVTSNVDTTAFLAWTSGELVFNRMPASEAMREISRWYDVDITLDPLLHDRTLTTVLHDQSLSEVINLVALSLDARVARAGNKVRLSAHRSAGIE